MQPWLSDSDAELIQQTWVRIPLSPYESLVCQEGYLAKITPKHQKSFSLHTSIRNEWSTWLMCSPTCQFYVASENLTVVASVLHRQWQEVWTLVTVISKTLLSDCTTTRLWITLALFVVIAESLLHWQSSMSSQLSQLALYFFRHLSEVTRIDCDNAVKWLELVETGRCDIKTITKCMTHYFPYIFIRLVHKK